MPNFFCSFSIKYSPIKLARNLSISSLSIFFDGSEFLLMYLTNLSVETFFLSILTIVFKLPPLNKPPIPQKTKGIATMNKKIFANIVFENFLNFSSILNETLYCFIAIYSIN